MIGNQDAVAFVDERIRPRCEQIRALLHQMQDDRHTWNVVMSSIIPNTDEAIQSGTPRKLKGQDIYNIMTRLNELLGVLEAQWAMDIVEKACVRPLGVTI